MNSMSEHQYFPQFIDLPPSQQNAANLFDWVCQVPVDGLTTGGMKLFEPEDRRPQMVIDVFGDITGFDVLELGPLEAAHSYQLERFGVDSILGIEASPEFYLKCLIVKEILGLKTNFLLGDFNLHLEETDKIYDLIFAAGVLYHMLDPLHTLYLISRHSPRAFFWTHYINEEDTEWRARAVNVHGYNCDYYEIFYDTKAHSRGWAGVNPSACRMKQKDILGALEFFGYDSIRVMEDTPDHPGGPAFSFVCHNTQFDTKQRHSKEDGHTDPYQEASYYRQQAQFLRTQINELSHELANLRKQITAGGTLSDEKLSAIYNSRSWKITAPLRKSSTLLRKWLR